MGEKKRKRKKEKEETRNRQSNIVQNFFSLFLQRFTVKKEGKIHILFFAFLVVCACCRNKVLQIETRERERGGAGESSFSFPFSFPLLESWFGTSEDKKDFKVGCFVVV